MHCGQMISNRALSLFFRRTLSKGKISHRIVITHAQTEQSSECEFLQMHIAFVLFRIALPHPAVPEWGIMNKWENNRELCVYEKLEKQTRRKNWDWRRIMLGDQWSNQSRENTSKLPDQRLKWPWLVICVWLIDKTISEQQPCYGRVIVPSCQSFWHFSKRIHHFFFSFFLPFPFLFLRKKEKIPNLIINSFLIGLLIYVVCLVSLIAWPFEFSYWSWALLESDFLLEFQ